jgi:hypothetical protein
MKNKEFYISEMLDVSAAVIHANANSDIDNYFVIEVNRSGASFYHLFKNEIAKKVHTRSWLSFDLEDYVEFADFKTTVQTYLEGLAS